MDLFKYIFAKSFFPDENKNSKLQELNKQRHRDIA